MIIACKLKSFYKEKFTKNSKWLEIGKWDSPEGYLQHPNDYDVEFELYICSLRKRQKHDFDEKDRELEILKTKRFIKDIEKPLCISISFHETTFTYIEKTGEIYLNQSEIKI